MENIEEFINKQKIIIAIERAHLNKSDTNSIHCDNDNNNFNQIDSMNIDGKDDENSDNDDKDQIEKNDESNNVDDYDISLNLHDKNEWCSSSNLILSSNKSEHKDMDQQWATDTFYSRFSNFGIENNQKDILARARQEDYNKYLKKLGANISENNPVANTSLNTKPTNQPASSEEYYPFTTNYTKYPKRPVNHNTFVNLNKNPIESKELKNSRNQLLDDLRHTDLPNIFHTNAIQERNQQIAQEKLRKKMEYQRDLIKQIEEKKREVEALRAKEKAEEERLTKKLEEQLKTMQLEDQLSLEKSRSERQRLANEQNHIYRMHLLSKLENDHQLYNPYDERKAHSENGKDKFVKADATDINLTEKPYKYFSNSARYPDRNTFRRRYTDETANVLMPIDDNEVLLPENHNFCKRCHPQQSSKNENICEHCNRQRQYEYCVRCNEHLHNLIEQRLGLCKKCQTTSNKCAYCRRNDGVCINCKQSYCLLCQKAQQKTTEPLIAHQHRSNKPSHLAAITTLNDFSGESEHELDAIDPIVLRNDGDNIVPYSVNVPRYSMFHPSNQSIYNSVDEIRRKTDERIAKYVKNYSDLSDMRSKRMPTIIARTSDDESFSLLREQWQNQNNVNSQHHHQSNFESKWKTPAIVQKNIISTIDDKPTKKPIRVLTQLGAVRRQLQLEKSRASPKSYSRRFSE